MTVASGLQSVVHLGTGVSCANAVIAEDMHKLAPSEESQVSPWVAELIEATLWGRFLGSGSPACQRGCLEGGCARGERAPHTRVRHGQGASESP